jgi:hypothetical protein
MALVTRFNRNEKEPKTHPTQVTGYWSVLRGENGKVSLFQIDTRGSDDRERLDKQSQTLQLSRDSAKELYTLLKYEFGF